MTGRRAGDLDRAGVTAGSDILHAELHDGQRLLTVNLAALGWLTSAGVGLLLDVVGRAGPSTRFARTPSG